jgi:hypothetical protein
VLDAPTKRGYIVARIVNHDSRCGVHGFGIPAGKTGYLVVHRNSGRNAKGRVRLYDGNKMEKVSDDIADFRIEFCKNETHAKSGIQLVSSKADCINPFTRPSVRGDSAAAQLPQQGKVKIRSHVGSWMTCSQGCCLARPQL